MSMTIGRRKLLTTSLGAAQFALLARYGLFSRRAHAAMGSRPTKLLCIYVPGGLNHELMWCPFPKADISKYMPSFENGGAGPENVANFDGSGDADDDAEVRRLRGVATWDWANPAGSSGYQSNGYVWASPDYQLYSHTSVLHGIDAGTAAHYSGVVSGMCGLASSNFEAPAIPAVVANYFLDKFPDRALPSVSIGGFPKAPALGLSASAGPTTLSRIDDLTYTIAETTDAWDGLRTRTNVPDLDFAGMPQDGEAPLTPIDAAVLEATRKLRGRSSSGTDALLETVHDQYRGLSKLLARDLVDKISNTPGAEYFPTTVPWGSHESRFGWRLGFADAYTNDSTYEPFDLALRLLKADVTTAVTLRVDPVINLDTHGGPYIDHRNYMRGALESVGRLCLELKLTPSPTDPSRTLLDDTLVYVFSEFGRTFSRGGAGGSDHYPMTSAVFVNSALAGNRMVGGFVGGDQNGVPVAIREESGEDGMRPPKSQDTAATIYAAMGMGLTDFFLPGGYGAVKGIGET